MKLDILIVDAVLIALVFLPYFLFILIGRREEKKLKNKFLEEALKCQLTIDESDSWNKTIIGLDKEKFKILLVQKRKTGIATELLDLKNVRDSEIIQEVQTVKIETNIQKILERIDLQLNLYNNSSQIINFYNSAESYSQEHELVHAEKWSSKINALTRFRPTLNSAA